MMNRSTLLLAGLMSLLTLSAQANEGFKADFGPSPRTVRFRTELSDATARIIGPLLESLQPSPFQKLSTQLARTAQSSEFQACKSDEAWFFGRLRRKAACERLEDVLVDALTQARESSGTLLKHAAETAVESIQSFVAGVSGQEEKTVAATVLTAIMGKFINAAATLEVQEESIPASLEQFCNSNAENVPAAVCMVTNMEALYRTVVVDAHERAVVRFYREAMTLLDEGLKYKFEDQRARESTI